MRLDSALCSMHGEATLRWPSVELSLESFRAYCAQISDAGASAELLRCNAADIYLCCACVKGDAVATRILEREAMEVVSNAIARIHRDAEFVRETLQEFWKKLLAGPQPKILEYRGRGPLQAWLRVVAARLAIDRYRMIRIQSGRETDLGECLIEQEFGPESTLTRERFGEPFRDALQHALTALTQKDRNLLRMHVVGRCSIDHIGRAYNVHRATAARWLEQARERILQSVRSELDLKGPRLTDSEFRSVARVVGADVELETAMFPTDEGHGQMPSTN